ncbi:tyrosine-type recombinase/integrase [Streptomyces sp. NPDC057552]|uniref:tyrosine-type recombinase/integrase n=1 Tax=Streptomyces sp. NPDC057552 TaxID=3350537 RepID=UPI0036AB4EB0
MPTITARQAAARWGVREATARRILAPLEAIGRDLETGAKLYDQDAADAARTSQPGRGARADLTATTLPDEQVDRLLADDTIPVAHRALWSFLRDGHARIGDVLSMDVRDVDPDEGVAQLDHPKLETDPRRIPISDRTAKLVREAAADRDAGPLIAGDRERPVTREAAARFARTAAGASIHSFRPKPHTAGERGES